MEKLKDVYCQKYPSSAKLIQYFEESTNVEFSWENLTKRHLVLFVEYLKQKVALSSAKVYCSRIKTILTLYREEFTPPKDYRKVLTLRKDTSQQVYLNADEIKAIINYSPQNEIESVIKNQFLIGCLTGARYSDCRTFSQENIRDNCLMYISRKTHMDTRVPVSPIIQQLLLNNKRQFCPETYNRTIKVICQRVGINKEVSLYRRGKFVVGEKWQFVSSHTARRSFATNLYLNGVDLYTISTLCGHSSVEMTKQYICCGPRQSDALLTYLAKFK